MERSAEDRAYYAALAQRPEVIAYRTLYAQLRLIPDTRQRLAILRAMAAER